MTSKVLQFTPRANVEKKDHGGNNGGACSGTIPHMAGRATTIIELSQVLGVHTERLPENPRVRLFFDILSRKKVLYLLQGKEGPVLPSDTLCVLSFNEEDETPDKISLPVADFYKYTADTLDADTEDYLEYLLSYTAKHQYILETEDEDPADFDNVEQDLLSNERGFFPEAIPMSSPDSEHGYDYEIIDPLLELHVSATSFVRDENYTPPLLFLAILAVTELAHSEGEVKEAQIQIARYGTNREKSRILLSSYAEFLEWIDAAILRGFPLLQVEKYNTPERRLEFIFRTIVVPRLDAKNLGGGYIPKGEE